MGFLPRSDRLDEMSNLLRRRKDVYRAGGEQAAHLAKVEADLRASLTEMAELLGAQPPALTQAFAEAEGGMPGVAAFGHHPRAQSAQEKEDGS